MMSIFYEIADTPIGLMLAAQSDRGLCAVIFGETQQEVLNQLYLFFPKKRIQECHECSRSIIITLKQYLDDPSTIINIPLDTQGTPFQEKVWTALQAIPIGQTISYSALAKKLDIPNATRAVANACANNRLALIIPCHRVIAKSGKLTGYRWGIHRKQSLLDKETHLG